jgi:hypothetical protein
MGPHTARMEGRPFSATHYLLPLSFGLFRSPDPVAGPTFNTSVWSAPLTGNCSAMPLSTTYPCYLKSSTISFTSGVLNMTAPGYSQLATLDYLSGASGRYDWGWGGAPILPYVSRGKRARSHRPTRS